MKTKPYFQKILVPVDGSHSCLHAKMFTALIAEKFQSKVTVIHVVTHEFMHPELKAQHRLPPAILNQIENAYLKAGKKIIRNAEELFREAGIEVDARLVKYEDPAETILQLVKEEEYNLVVIGNRSKTQAERFSLGSVTEKVVRHAGCPVLIVKQHPRITKMLVAIDGSKNADKGLEYAVQLAQKHGSKITLLNVEEDKLFRLEPKAIEGVGKCILCDAVAARTPQIKEVDFDQRLEFGSPAKTITKIAKKENYDLIIVGSRGLSSVKRFFLGSVSDDVSMHSRCSVLIAR
jgi:nucleotide-binding universal stress UspA family protein